MNENKQILQTSERSPRGGQKRTKGERACEQDMARQTTRDVWYDVWYTACDAWCAYDVTWYHIIWYVILYHNMLYHMIWYDVILYHMMSRHIKWCYMLWYDMVWYVTDATWDMCVWCCMVCSLASMTIVTAWSACDSKWHQIIWSYKWCRLIPRDMTWHDMTWRDMFAWRCMTLNDGTVWDSRLQANCQTLDVDKEQWCRCTASYLKLVALWELMAERV